MNSEIGWRLAFGLGGTPAMMILVARRHVPESPRWLFIHGRDEAEKIVQGIEKRDRATLPESTPSAGGTLAGATSSSPRPAPARRT